MSENFFSESNAGGVDFDAADEMLDPFSAVLSKPGDIPAGDLAGDLAERRKAMRLDEDDDDEFDEVDPADFLASVAGDTSETMAQNMAVTIDTMPGVSEKVKDNTFIAAESGGLKQALNPSVNAAMVAAFASVFADPEVQKSLGVNNTTQAANLKAAQAVRRTAASRASLRAPRPRVTEESAEDVADLLDPEKDNEPSWVPEPGTRRGVGIAQTLTDSALTASALADSAVGTTEALAVTAQNVKEIADLTGITREDFAAAGKQMKAAYGGLEKRAGKAATQVGKGGKAAGRAVNRNTKRAYAGLKNKKSALMKSERMTSAKSAASKRASSVRGGISKKGASASRTASSAKRSAGRKASSVGRGIRSKAGKLKRKAIKAQFGEPSGAVDYHDIAIMVMNGEALELALAEKRTAHDAAIQAAPYIGEPEEVAEAESERLKALEVVETASISSTVGEFDEVDAMVDDALETGLALGLETEKKNAGKKEGKKKNAAAAGMLGGFTKFLGDFFSKDGGLMKAYQKVQAGVVEYGGVVLQKLQYGIKKYWKKLLTEWLPVWKEYLGEWTDVFLRETLPDLMRELPNLLVEGVGAIADVIKAVVAIVGMIGDLVGEEFENGTTFHARLLDTFTHDDLDAVIAGDLDEFSGRFFRVHADEVSASTMETLKQFRDYVCEGGYADSEARLTNMMIKAMPELHSAGALDNIFGLFKKKDKKKVEEAEEETEEEVEDVPTEGVFDLFKKKDKKKDKKEEAPAPATIKAPSVTSAFGPVSNQNLLELFRKIRTGEDGFSRSQEAVMGYAEEIASALTLGMATMPAPNGSEAMKTTLRKEMSRTIITFLLMMVNKIGDLNTPIGTRPFEDMVEKWLSGMIDQIAAFQKTREQIKRLAAQKAMEKARASVAAEQARLAAEAERLNEQLAALAPKTGDLPSAGSFGNILGGLKGMIGGGATKVEVSEESVAEAKRLSEEARAMALAKIEEQINNPEKVVERSLIGASNNILAIAAADASSVDDKVWDFMDKLLSDAVGGDYQGRDPAEANLLRTMVQLLSAVMLYFMNAEGQWADTNLGLLVDKLDSPLHSRRVAESIQRLRNSTASRNILSTDTSFSIDDNRKMLEESVRGQAPGFSVHDFAQAMSVIHQKRKDIPSGARVYVIDDPHPQSILVTLPSASLARSLSGEHYRVSGTTLRRHEDSATSHLVPHPKRSAEFEISHKKPHMMGDSKIFFCASKK